MKKRYYYLRDALTETSLYKIGERYYDPSLARWTQKDPMMQAFSPREANGYTYAGCDPINLTDPSGAHIVGDAWGTVSGAADDAWIARRMSASGLVIARVKLAVPSRGSGTGDAE